MNKITIWLQQNLLFVVASLLAVVSVVLGRFEWTFIKYDVLASLFGLMVVLGLFKGSGLLRRASIKLIDWSKNTRILVQSMTLISFLGSFLLSNDIAVLTLLPIYLHILSHLPKFKGQVLGAVLIVVAANLGGVFFPFSNPQNLIIYSNYPVGFGPFMLWTLPLMVAGFVLVFLPTIFVEKQAAHANLKANPVDQKLVIEGAIGMVIMVLAIFGLLNVYLTAVFVGFYVLLTKWQFLKEVDYLLLLTFASFFILVGNITDLPLVQNWMTANVGSPKMSYLTGIFASQVISNVPTTILVSPFTQEAHALLLGVNIGGLGTMVASLANLIGMSIIRASMTMRSKSYIKQFSIVNFAILIVLTILFFPWG